MKLIVDAVEGKNLVYFVGGVHGFGSFQNRGGTQFGPRQTGFGAGFRDDGRTV